MIMVTFLVTSICNWGQILALNQDLYQAAPKNYSISPKTRGAVFDHPSRRSGKQVLGRAEKTDSQNTSLSIVAGKYGHRPTFHCFIFGKTVRKLNRKKQCKHKIIYFELLVIESWISVNAFIFRYCASWNTIPMFISTEYLYNSSISHMCVWIINGNDYRFMEKPYHYNAFSNQY